MGRSRRLKSVVHDFTHFLCSRNFDLMGYWGMGVLAVQILEAGSLVGSYSLDHGNFANSLGGKSVQKLQALFDDLAGQQGVSRSQIQSAELRIALYKVSRDSLRPGGVGVGYDFRLTVTARAKSGAKYQSERVGWVVPLGGEEWFKAPRRSWLFRRE